MDNEQGAIAVPLSLFGGESLEISPPDIPEGVSPECFDMAFIPGSCYSRPGLNSILTNIPAQPFASVLYLKTYIEPNGTVQTLMFDTNGFLWAENVNVTPGIRAPLYLGLNAPPLGSPPFYMQSVTAFGREYFATSDGLHGLGIPLQWDGSFSGGNANLDRVTQDGPGLSISVSDSGSAGTVAAGQHQCVVMYLTRNGAITAPSPAVNWTAAGSKKVSITNLPIGPSNVVARIIAFTGAGGANFFYIPTQISLPNPGGPPTVVASTVVNDNTSSSVTLDFSDTALFGATAIDIPGRNLFAQVVLGPVLGFFSYGNRLFAYGEANKVQNLQNMGFDGGSTASAPGTPLGWSAILPGGSLVAGGAWSGGQAWAITGDGTFNVRGALAQGAYQDANGLPIILPNTAYTFRVWVQGGSSNATVTGQFYSPSLGTISIVSVSISTDGLGSNTNRYVQGTLGVTPTVLPSDLQFRVFISGLPLNVTAIIDEVSLIYTQNPWNPNSRVSYVNNPEGFDGVTGVLGPAGDQSGIQVCYQQKDVMYFHTLSGMYSTRDTGTTEPAQWNIGQISSKVGAVSFRAADAGSVGTGTAGEDFAFVASRSGLYVYAGGEPLKISQEQQPRWDLINWAAAAAIWIKNDISARRLYVALPLNQDTSPSVLLTMDYKELNTAPAIESSGPIRISFTGKMIASDMTRKWSPWNLRMPCGELLVRPGNTSQFCMGGMFTDNIYFLDPLKLTDDDYGTITPYWISYGFLNHEMEQQLGVGSHRKLFVYLTMFVSGVGQLFVTPLAGSLTNARPSMVDTLTTNPDHDMEFGLNVTSERCFFKIQSTPLPGQTDNSFNLQKMVVSVKPDPWSLVRGAI